MDQDDEISDVDTMAGHVNDLTLMVESGDIRESDDVNDESTSTHGSESFRDQESTSDSDEIFFILSEDHFSDDISRDFEDNVDFDVSIFVTLFRVFCLFSCHCLKP